MGPTAATSTSAERLVKAAVSLRPWHYQCWVGRSFPARARTHQNNVSGANTDALSVASPGPTHQSQSPKSPFASTLHLQGSA